MANGGGLDRVAGKIQQAGISFLTGIPQIELDRQAADIALVEAQAGDIQSATEQEKVKAQADLDFQRLSRTAFAGGPAADAALQEIFIRNPEQAEELFSGLGAVDQSQREDISRRAAEIQGTPPEQRRPLILQQAAEIEARGGDARQTLSLLEMAPEDQDQRLRIVQAAAQSTQERSAAAGAAETRATAARQATVAERGVQLREDELVAARGLSETERVNKKVETNLKTEEGLRKEVNTLLKDFFQVADANARVLAAGINPSAAGDLALIFNFMKMLDPGSTVREGEFANAQNSASVPQRIRGLYNSITEGERLSEAQRGDFLDRAESLFGAAQDEAAKTAGAFERIATNAGVNVNNVLATFQARSGTAPAAPQQVGRFTIVENP